jgi:predicted rRNA methylase YqxC with S4 and FtsJ domains
MSEPEANRQQDSSLEQPTPADDAVDLHDEEIELSNPSQPASVNRRVMIAVDPSEHSTYAIKYAIEKILNPATDLVFVINVRAEVPRKQMDFNPCQQVEKKMS